MPYINEYEHETIIRLLNPSDNAVIEDKMTLSAYERKEINIGEAKRRFMKTNDIRGDMMPSNDLFDRWARSLGYLRRED